MILGFLSALAKGLAGTSAIAATKVIIHDSGVFIWATLYRSYKPLAKLLRLFNENKARIVSFGLQIDF